MIENNENKEEMGSKFLASQDGEDSSRLLPVCDSV
jgi:hypothetical protein